MLKPVYTIFFILFGVGTLLGQKALESKPAELSSVKIYTSISEIAANPDSVLYIDFSKQKLKAFPEEIFACKNLVYLDLKRNKIESIPPEIAGLTKLRVLNVARNYIEEIPPQIGMCNELRTLIINQNELTSVCPEIGLLQNLAVLDLWGNGLTVLPKEIGRISSSLKFLDLRVMQMTREEQSDIENLLPETTIYFSNSCNCK